MFESFDDVLAKDISCATGLTAERVQAPSKNLYPSLPGKRRDIDVRLRRLKARRDPLGLEKAWDETKHRRGKVGRFVSFGIPPEHGRIISNVRVVKRSKILNDEKHTAVESVTGAFGDAGHYMHFGERFNRTIKSPTIYIPLAADGEPSSPKAKAASRRISFSHEVGHAIDNALGRKVYVSNEAKISRAYDRDMTNVYGKKWRGVSLNERKWGLGRLGVDAQEAFAQIYGIASGSAMLSEDYKKYKFTKAVRDKFPNMFKVINDILAHATGRGLFKLEDIYGQESAYSVRLDNNHAGYSGNGYQNVEKRFGHSSAGGVWRDNQRPGLGGVKVIGADAGRAHATRPTAVSSGNEASRGFLDFNGALNDIARNPSQAQIAAGNYKKGHINIHGINIAIENPIGGWRRGVDPDGKQWECQLPAHYGCVKRTEGNDGDAVDVFVGPAVNAQHVYIIDQVDPDSGRFDEHKCMMQFGSPFEASTIYQKAFSDGKATQRIGAMTTVTIDEFKGWLKGDTTKPVAYMEPMAKGFVDFDEMMKGGRDDEPRDGRGRWASGGSNKMLSNAGVSGPARRIASPKIIIDLPKKGIGFVGVMAEKTSKKYHGGYRAETHIATDKKYSRNHTPYNPNEGHYNYALLRDKFSGIRQASPGNQDMHVSDKNKWVIRHEHGHAIDRAFAGGRANAAKIIGSTVPIGKKYAQATGGLSAHPDIRRAWMADVDFARDNNFKALTNWSQNPSEAVADVIASRTGHHIPALDADANAATIRGATPKITGILRRMLSRKGIMLKYDRNGGTDGPYKNGIPSSNDAGWPGPGGGGRPGQRCDLGRGEDYDNAISSHRHSQGGLEKEEIHCAPVHFIDFNTALAKSETAKKPATIEIAEQHEGALAKGVRHALGWLHDQGDTVAAAASKGPTAAANAVPVADFGGKLDGAFDTITNIVATSGDRVANDNLPPAKDTDKRIDFHFDARNVLVTDFLEKYRMDLIQQITGDQRSVIHDIVTKGIAAGDDLAKTARSIRDVIGLTASQGENVENYRQELENLDKGALKRALRDKRSDGVISKAIKNDEPLDDDYINSAVEKYKKSYIAYRSSVIARTESLRSAISGARLGMEQLLDDPEMDGMTVERTWMATGDSRTRDDHRALNGQTIVGMDSAYELPDGGTIAYPMDPEAEADETVQCRCTETYRIVSDDVEKSDGNWEMEIGTRRSTSAMPVVNFRLILTPWPLPAL